MSALQEKFDQTLSRADELLRERVRREELELERQDATDRVRARVKARENAEARREIASRYDDSFRSFGVETPAPVDDEAPAAYRRRLFNRLARKLSPRHELAEIRADDVSTSPVVMDRFEAMLLEAAQAEGLTPSLDNLPDDGSMLMRTRTDEDTGFKSNNFYGKR